MMFNGAKKYGPKQFDIEMEKAGGRNNAYTSRDVTVCTDWFPRSALETADQLAGVLGDIELYGLNRGEIDDYFSRIDAVTVEKANELARRWLGQESLQFCVLGNAAKIKESVAKHAPAMKVIAVTEPGIKTPEF
jgi:predicted Zn-dependent peptidase